METTLEIVEGMQFDRGHLRIQIRLVFVGIHLCQVDHIHHRGMVPLDEVRHDLSVRGDGLDGGPLIIANQAAVPLDIGAEDGGELSLDVFGGLSISLPSIKKAPERTELSAGGSMIAALWKHEVMIPSQKVGVVLWGGLKQHESKQLA